VQVVRSHAARSAWLRYGAAVACAVFATGLGLAFRGELGTRAIDFLCFAAVAISATYGGAGPGLLTTLLGIASTAYFFTDPFYNFRIDRFADALTLMLFAAVGASISLVSGAMYRGRARNDAILRSVADCYYALDRNWKFVDLNDRAADHIGKPREELIGRSLLELFPYIAGSDIERHYRRAMEEREAAHFESPSAIDHTRWMEVRAYPAPDGLAVFFTDVTARKSAEEELRRQRDLTRAITDHAAESLFLTDGQGRVTFMNAAAEVTFGWTLDELRGQVLHDVIHRHRPDGVTPLPISECPLSRVLVTGRAMRSHEDVFFHRDGSHLHVACSNAPIVDEQGKVKAAVLVAHDITHRVRVEQALRNSEARLAAIFNQAGVGIAQTDLRAHYLLVNRRYAEMVGRTTQELLGMRVSDVTHWDDQEPQERLIRSLTRGEGEGDRVVEKRYVRPDGTIVWGQLSVTVVRDAAGNAHALLGVVQEITDRKRAEEALRDAKEAAEAANRAKDRFLAVLSHELRTPLTPVLTTVQLLEREPSLTADVREQMSMIRRNVELEARLIDDLLDLNRVSHGKLQLQLGSPDVHEKLKNVLQICDSDARAKGVHLTAHLDAPRRHVRGDAARLQQIFWNLLKNAIKFTPEGGRVEVETRCEHCGQGDEAVERLVVRVRDTGVGIDPAVLPTIFDAFVQGDGSINRTFGGLGLGLAITRALVELHRGTITVASEGPGTGATFEVSLPLVADTADGADSGDAPSRAFALPGGPGHRGRAAAATVAGELAGARILLVEDDEDSAKILARLLRRSGAAVQTADSVAMGLQVALADPHDLVISDIGLPDGSGLDLMRQLIAARRESRNSDGNGNGGSEAYPAIALSGFGMEEDIRQSREAGFAEHLTKPVNLDQLHDAIKRVLAGAGKA
jgi:two-component system CheB/CheR fusion protein